MKKTRNKKSPKNNSKKKRTRRTKLERATAAYFDSQSPQALEEENRLGAALGQAASQVNFDE
jgi:hypothetical protein